MFSPERIIHNFLETTDKSFASLSWRKLFKEFFYILYFQKHLSFHFLKPYKIIICLDSFLERTIVFNPLLLGTFPERPVIIIENNDGMDYLVIIIIIYMNITNISVIGIKQ